MTIRLTQAELEEQFQEAGEEELHFDPSDELDTTWKFMIQFVQGWQRRIDLRKGIHLEISQSQPSDFAIITNPACESHYIHCLFLLLGNTQARLVSASSETIWTHAAGGYWLSGTGSREQLIQDMGETSWSSISIDIDKSVFCSFAASSEGELPKHLQHLVRPVSQAIYRRIGSIQPMMANVLPQILRCPYQGMIKRAFLESKAIELLALVLADEAAIQQGDVRPLTLKPEQIEQIHYAKEILLRDMYNPPSLAELARQAGLNEFTLKAGFRQVFGTTVFGELRAYRLEMAKQLLAEQNISVAVVAQQVGYGSARALARAFRQKFGIGPKSYQKACR